MALGDNVCALSTEDLKRMPGQEQTDISDLLTLTSSLMFNTRQMNSSSWRQSHQPSSMLLRAPGFSRNTAGKAFIVDRDVPGVLSADGHAGPGKHRFDNLPWTGHRAPHFSCSRGQDEVVSRREENMPLSLYTPLFQLGRYVSSDAVEMPAFYQITSRKNKAEPVSWTVSASFPGESA
jgi:hypothetical protein